MRKSLLSIIHPDHSIPFTMLKNDLKTKIDTDVLNQWPGIGMHT